MASFEGIANMRCVMLVAPYAKSAILLENTR
jgi:hypothetical protein